jgi:hypothetical protein
LINWLDVWLPNRSVANGSPSIKIAGFVFLSNSFLPSPAEQSTSICATRRGIMLTRPLDIGATYLWATRARVTDRRCRNAFNSVKCQDSFRSGRATDQNSPPTIAPRTPPGKRTLRTSARERRTPEKPWSSESTNRMLNTSHMSAPITNPVATAIQTALKPRALKTICEGTPKTNMPA